MRIKLVFGKCVPSKKPSESGKNAGEMCCEMRIWTRKMSEDCKELQVGRTAHGGTQLSTSPGGLEPLETCCCRRQGGTEHRFLRAGVSRRTEGAGQKLGAIRGKVGRRDGARGGCRTHISYAKQRRGERVRNCLATITTVC